ncbi:MAG TPA: UvrD-helicase domain-containing protein, partial [Solirubrobacterales bacterium]|nr:UvrD-helicase domain-containing protein [Solirubrobacterales bacterium]
MPEDQTTLSSALSERQRAIEHGAGPLLVIGAPGTGKTELLARLLARIDGLKAERVGPTTLRERAEAATAEDEAGREENRREQEFA